jgi:hypothetical protein
VVAARAVTKRRKKTPAAQEDDEGAPPVAPRAEHGTADGARNKKYAKSEYHRIRRGDHNTGRNTEFWELMVIGERRKKAKDPLEALMAAKPIWIDYDQPRPDQREAWKAAKDNGKTKVIDEGHGISHMEIMAGVPIVDPNVTIDGSVLDATDIVGSMPTSGERDDAMKLLGYCQWGKWRRIM